MSKIILLKKNGEEVEFNAEHGSTIFDQLQNAGYELPHGCLAGSCGACKIEIIEGNQNLNEESIVENDTISHLKACKKSHNKIRLSCRAKIIEGSVKIKEI